jgi:hypothetical protein
MVLFIGLLLVTCGFVMLIITGTFFANKMASSLNRYQNLDTEKHQSQQDDSDSIRLSRLEATFFMGIIWTRCVHDGRMSKNAFKSWFVFTFSLAVICIVAGVSFYDFQTRNTE